MNRDLQRFIRDALGRGLPRPAIREALRQAGWRADEIDAALGLYAETEFAVPVPRRRPYLSAREAFLYLVLFATLYTTAYDVGQVLFGLIERWIRDPVAGSYDWRNYGEWVRGATAGIIIAFPIYLILSRVIGREVAREPEKRGSPVRKWLTYITLFIAALVIIGDLIVLVNRVLSGDLATRFVLKVLVVFAIAGTVFWHYLADLRREEADEPGGAQPGVSPLARIAGALVIVVMAAGLIFAGSPSRERLRRMDEQRIEALSTIGGAIDNYYNTHGHLPDSLQTLLGLPNAFEPRMIRDPETQRPYEYRRAGEREYELCAEFRTEETQSRAASPLFAARRSQFWTHGVGSKCYHFEVTAGPIVPPVR